ncbi:ATP-binding protein [Algibacillus agarilyticus]|uniref:ATP-binding protein n=1 Tax=Algibacillus agarilyticus TaxID=2234133 RepID=UPI000DCF6829|nr:PAS domain-containing hybrid sensor histidine kinase/response regulator [Algibacillus agarilyticus]
MQPTSESNLRISLESVKNDITNILLAVFTFVGFFAVLMSSSRALTIGLQPAMFFQLFAWIVIASLYFLKHKINYKIRAFTVIFLLLVMGLIGILNFGLVGSGILILFFSCAISALIINGKAGLICLITSSVMIMSTALLSYFEYINFATPIHEHDVITTWIAKFAAFLIFSTVIIFAANRLFQYLIDINKQLKRALKKNIARADESEMLLEAVLNAVPYRIFWKDNNLNYIGANAAFKKDANLAADFKIKGLSDFDLPWAKTESELYRADDQEVIDQRQAKLNIEEQQTDAQGNTFYLLTNKVPLCSEQGKLIGILGAYDEITARKNMEIELRTAKEKADAASIAKSAFLANMSHEIRTPLNGVFGLIDLCLNSNLDAQQKQYLSQAQSSARLLLTILNDILDISKIEAGKFELEYLDFDLKDVLSKINLFTAPLANAKNIQFSMHTHLGKKTWYKGDPTRISQILLNLSSNAIKFTHQGKVTITTGITEASDRTSLHIQICDTGIGIAEQHLTSLFDNFTQADNSISRQFGGTGLGLSIVKKICELMGGKIEVSSQVNVGSTFDVYLPLETAIPSAPNNTNNTNNKEEMDLTGLTILVVEDNAINAMIVHEMLEHAGASVIEAENGLEALNRLHDHLNISLVLMDIQMPKMDGCETIKIIRAKEKWANLAIIALTANVMSSEIKHYYELGFNAHIGKPYERIKLLSTINTLVNKR